MFDLNTPVIDEEVDHDRLCEYIETLMNEFSESPEAVAFIDEHSTRIGWAATYMEYAATYFGETPATMTARDSNEILFDIFPRKVSIEPESATAVIGEMRAFWGYLKPTRDLEHADAILETLTDDGAETLEAELADEYNFGLAKSFFMAGKKNGFDMTSQAGLDQFAALYNASRGQPAPGIESDEPNVDDRRQTGRASSTIRNLERRVGRNEPCPCGSGRKYKKCCGG